MILIDDYTVLSFLNWANKNGILIDQKEEALDRLADSFLNEKFNNFNIKLLMKSIQDFSVIASRFEIIDKDELPELMKIFFDKNTPTINYIYPSSLIKSIRLHPLFMVFIEYLNENGQLGKINSILSNERLEKKHDFAGWLSYLSESEVPELLINNFITFLKNPFFTSEVSEYRYWLEKKIISFDKDSNFEQHHFYAEYYFLKSSIINSHFLAKTLYVDEETQYEPVFEMMMYPSMGMVEEETYLDFLHFVANTYNLSKPISGIELNELLAEYLESYPLADKRSLRRFVRNSRGGRGIIASLLERIPREFGSQFKLERIQKPKLHGILLFPAHQSLSSFLKKFGKDIHHMSGDYMDVYYTRRDLIEDKSCYEIAKKLPNMDVSNGDFPALIVWEKFGGKVEKIVVDGLEFEEVYSIIKILVDKIKVIPVLDAIEVARSKVDEIVEGKKSKIVYFDMRNSQIGAVGENARSINQFNKKDDN